MSSSVTRSIRRKKYFLRSAEQNRPARVKIMDGGLPAKLVRLEGTVTEIFDDLAGRSLEYLNLVTLQLDMFLRIHAIVFALGDAMRADDEHRGG